MIAYTEQQTLDAVCLALAEGFGFGEERLKRFHDAFNAKYAKIRELEKRDTKDNEYAIAKQEAALKAACGKYYSPREVRYDIKIVTRDGKQHKLQITILRRVSQTPRAMISGGRTCPRA